MAIASHLLSTHCSPSTNTPIFIPQGKLALLFSIAGWENAEFRLDLLGWKLEAIAGFFPDKYMIKNDFFKKQTNQVSYIKRLWNLRQVTLVSYKWAAPTERFCDPIHPPHPSPQAESGDLHMGLRSGHVNQKWPTPTRNQWMDWLKMGEREGTSGSATSWLCDLRQWLPLTPLPLPICGCVKPNR